MLSLAISVRDAASVQPSIIRNAHGGCHGNYVESRDSVP